MSWVEILLLAIFVAFPIIQALLEKLGAGRREQLPPDEDHGERPEGTVATAQSPQKGEESWSAGWGSWPSESEALEELAAEEVLEEQAAEEMVALQERLVVREVPEANRVSTPVVSLEQLEVDRAAEHLRFHRRTAPKPPAAPRPQLIPAGTLRSPAELRRAIVLAEVLGPPRALQPAERPPSGA